MKAMIVLASGHTEEREIEGTLSEIQALVGGFIEPFDLGGDAHLYMDEEGKYADPPKQVNFIATALAEHFHPGFVSQDRIVGDVVMLGQTGGGDEADVPDRIIDLVGRTAAHRRTAAGVPDKDA